MAQANCVSSADCEFLIGAGAGQSTDPLQSAHRGLIGWLAAHSPSSLPIAIQSIDVEDRAEDVAELLSCFSTYLRLLLGDSAQNVPIGLDFRQIEALLADLCSEVAGTLRKGAESLKGRLT
jgi:hypothetical protein